MTAYSHNSYAAREKVRGDRTQRVTIKHDHPLNNQHRAPYGSGAQAARALLVHAQREMSDPETGPTYFNRLRGIYDGATISGRQVQERLEQRQLRAATALQMGDVELTDDQIPMSFERAQVQALIATKLLPEVQASGRANSAVIDDVDLVTRNAMRAAATARIGVEYDGADPETAPLRDPNQWQNALLARLEAVPGIDHSDDAELVSRFARVVYQLEATLPLAIERDEPLYEIGDDFYNPRDLADTRNALSEAQGEYFAADDIRNDVLDQQARDAVYASMNMEEREFAATMIALTPSQRIEAGMAIINSTPPIIVLPEAKLAEGRYDVIMNSEEESVVMDNLIRWAGEVRTFPGLEEAAKQLEDMKSLTMPSGELGAPTLALVVDSNPAAISHAQAMAGRLEAKEPGARLIVLGEEAAVAQVMEARRASLETAGVTHDVRDGSDANRELGGWTLPGNADRALTTTARDVDLLVAAADDVFVYGRASSLESTTVSQSQNRLREAEALTKTTQAEFTQFVKDAKATGSPELVARIEAAEDNRGSFTTIAKEMREAGVKGQDLKTADELVRRALARSAASKREREAERVVERLGNQNKAAAFQRAPKAEIAQSRAIDAASRQGKLRNVYHPAPADARTSIQTPAGALVEQRPASALRVAETLLDGEEHRTRELRDALGAGLGSRYNGRRSITATFVAGSNVFDERLDMKTGELRKGRDGKVAEPNKGLQALSERLDTLSKNGVILVEGNDRNPIVRAVLEKERRVIHAVAWRVENVVKTEIDGQTRTMRDRSTELDLGIAALKSRGEERGAGVRQRQFSGQDLKGAVVVVHGGGSMNRATYDAIQDEALRRGKAGHGLSPNEVKGIYNDLVKSGRRLEEPKLADVKHGRAITQEKMVDIADQGIVASEMVSDYNAANYMRLARDADKLIAVYDRTGNPVPMDKVAEHSAKFAKSIADNTLDALSKTLTLSAASPSGQLILAQHKGVTPEKAHEIGKSFGTLRDVMVAAEAGEASEALPRAMHHQLSLANGWKRAVERAANISDRTVDNGMSGLVPSDPQYPDTLKNTGRTPIIYTMKDVDMTQPTVALLVGGESKVNDADLEATRRIAAEANAKGYAVSLHLSGEAAAKVATDLAKMPDGERPRILLVGNGHPTVHPSAAEFEAIVAVASVDRGGYATTVPPIPHADSTPEQLREDTFTYLKDASSGVSLVASQATAAVLVKSTGSDASLVSMRNVIEQDKPVGVVGPIESQDPQVTDLRFRGPDYSANRRMLAGAGAVEVMMESRYQAFEPSFISDMSGDMENRYIPFEGSTAGKQNLRDNNRDDQPFNNAIASGQSIRTTIDWNKAATSVQDGRGFGEFLAAVEDGRVESIRATEQDRISRSLENDARFLDVASRSKVSEEVREIFTEIDERSAGDIQMDLQDQFLRQRSGTGR
jgi:hypothetical protein